MTLIDSHCHLNHADFFDDLPEVLRRAQDVGVEQIVCVGYDMESSVQAVKLAREIRMVHSAVGVHPHDAVTFTPDMKAQLRKLAEDREHVVAIGETGLDYFRALSPKDIQQEAFRRHIDLAHELSLPLIVHSRDAQEDVLAILKEKGVPKRGAVMHCLASDAAFAKGALALGCYLGIAGTVTFKNTDAFREIVRGLPLERLLVETDAPYLAPHPYRGQRNEPSHVALTAQTLADVLGIDVETVQTQTTANARQLFGLGG